MQYQSYSEGVYVEYSDGISTFREGVRNLIFVTDKTISSLGFNGIENTDWVNLRMRTLMGITGIYRDGTRNNMFTLDETLTPSGFSGTESLDEGITGDWVNVESIP